MMRGKKSSWGRGFALSVTALSGLVFTACTLATHGIGDSDGGGSEVRGTRCEADTDCPHASAACVRAACVSGVCKEVLEAEGPSATILQQPRDCYRLLCDGKGGTVNVVDDADLPDDDNPCTEDTCHGGIAANALV